ncbi:hypothetical protein C0992_007165, partial [Termitomyces sp. T32_za158]
MATYARHHYPTGYQEDSYGYLVPDPYAAHSPHYFYPSTPYGTYLSRPQWTSDHIRDSYGTPVGQGFPANQMPTNVAPPRLAPLALMPYYGYPCPPSSLHQYPVPNPQAWNCSTAAPTLQTSFWPWDQGYWKIFAQRTRMLLLELGQNDFEGSLEEWASCLLNLQEWLIQEYPPEHIRYKLWHSPTLRHELQTLLDELQGTDFLAPAPVLPLVPEQPLLILEQLLFIPEQPSSVPKQPSTVLEQPSPVSGQLLLVPEQPSPVMEPPPAVPEQLLAVPEQPLPVPEPPFLASEQLLGIPKKLPPVPEQSLQAPEQPAEAPESLGLDDSSAHLSLPPQNLPCNLETVGMTPRTTSHSGPVLSPRPSPDHCWK